MGRAAGGGAGRAWGMGKVKKTVREPKLPDPIRRSGQTQENQESEHRDTDYGNHRVLSSECFQPRDHFARRPRPRKWPKGYIRIGTLVPPAGYSVRSIEIKPRKKRAPHWEALEGRYR